MGWSLGWDGKWDRDIGYGVPAWCDHPGCGALIDRGLSYVCGGDVYGGESGCGLYFCSAHLFFTNRKHDCHQYCERCACRRPKKAFEPTPDHPQWIAYKLTDKSWAEWRKEHPEFKASVVQLVDHHGGLLYVQAGHSYKFVTDTAGSFLMVVPA